MDELLDLEAFPVDRPGCREYARLVDRCRRSLANGGMFNLPGFVRQSCLDSCIQLLQPDMASRSFHHKRDHNIYFQDEIDGVDKDHPSMTRFSTSNRTLCADQLTDNPLTLIYEWQPLIDFLAAVMGMKTLHVMKDPLARLNVMAYSEGDALNWHFDRSEFTITLLLQRPDAGGIFEYRTGLRTTDDPNYEGVAALLLDIDPQKRAINPEPGTLNVFLGANTPHRVTKVEGSKERLVAVFSYYDTPNVVFTPKERIGFYGREA